MQLDKGRAEFEKLSKKSEENRSKTELERSEFVQVQYYCIEFFLVFRKSERNGTQMRRSRGS